MFDPKREFSRRSLIKNGALGTAVVAAGAWLPRIASAQVGAKPVIARTAEGSLRGYQTPTLNVFKGIRYGEVTSGARRFRPPVQARPWKGVRDALTLGPPSPQRSNSDTQAWLDPVPGSEDCLSLNVWSPRKPEPLPVMVFMHGGGFRFGSGGVPGYDGSGLAERGSVVVVTVNHRLNAFGYLYLGGLSDEFKDSANLGQLDLVAALRWVRRNIRRFGGDPSNVTIFGESGGGAKVSVLASMPMARGLFHKAIVQSGSTNNVRSEAAATEVARAFVAELGLTAATIGEIRELPLERILQAYLRMDDKKIPGAFSPFQHSATVPYQPSDMAARQLWKDVPLLVGTNDAETAAQTAKEPEAADDTQLFAQLQAYKISGVGELGYYDKEIDPATARALVAAYRKRMPNASRKELLITITSGVTFWNRAVRQAELKAEMNAAPVYRYEYGWKDPVPGGNWAIHGVELPFVFDKLDLPWLWDDSNTPAARAKLDPEGRRFRLRDATIAAWSGFARRGTPANPLMPSWPPFTPQNRAVMYIDTTSELQIDPFGPEVRAIATSLLVKRT